MLRLAFFFFLLAIIAGVLGFTGIAGPAMTIAKVLFFAFLIIWGVLLLLGLTIYKSLT